MTTDPKRPDAPGDTLEGLMAQFGNLIGQWEQRAYGRPAMNERPEEAAVSVSPEELERQKREREHWGPLVEQARESGRQEAYAAVERHLLGTESLSEEFHTACVIKRHDAQVEARARLAEAKQWSVWLAMADFNDCVFRDDSRKRLAQLEAAARPSSEERT